MRALALDPQTVEQRPEEALHRRSARHRKRGGLRQGQGDRLYHHLDLPTFIFQLGNQFQGLGSARIGEE